jgi:putative oxygen-independent coproporphyrinogen III oxidase
VTVGPEARAEKIGPAAGLYVHVPFCSAVCPYCDFAVRKGGREKVPAYLAALRRELGWLAERAAAAPPGDPLALLLAGPFDTLYFGGGTPSVLAEEDLAGLIAHLRQALPVAAATRLFFEANPEDVTAESLAAWRRAGVHLLSLGVQSLDDASLAHLGRRHTARQAEVAIRAAQDAGFPTLSVDLIYGRPGQTVAAWRAELERAIALEPDHFSLYELEIHERTAFGKKKAAGKLRELPEGEQAELFELTHRVLADHGYEGYEVSNFARGPEHRSAHNQKYWRHVPYLGLGPGAHSYSQNLRWWNLRDEPTWRRALKDGLAPIEAAETLEPKDLALESLMLGLRTREGADLAEIRQRWGIDVETQNLARIAAWKRSDLLEDVPGRLVPTLRGFAVADRLAAEIELP